MDERSVLDMGFAYVDAINNKDVDDIVRLASADHVFVDLEGGVHPLGAEGRVREAWQGYFRIAPRYVIHVAEAYARGDVAVLVGRTTASHLRVPDVEEFFGDRLVWTAEIVAGRVRTWRIAFDTPAERATWGIPPAAGPSSA